MHFETMLCFIGVDRHSCKARSSLKLGYGGFVERKVTEGRFVAGALRERAAREVRMVGGTQEEDTLAVQFGVSI